MVVEINTEEMYKQIKKQNGEQFARVLRQNVLLDIPNLKHILEFAGTEPKDAENLVPVLKEIRKESGKADKTKQEEEIKDPIELLSEAGYDAFIVKNERQKNSIKKYYRPDEELCTFRDPNRHEKFYIIHAIKKNVKDIKRGNPPKREDEYGTSVISIQIAKTGGFISIKNRYNHTVDNPDATFNNNPDNIIPGLTAALKSKFGVDFMTQEATMPDNYRLVRNQLVRFNCEVDNVYYGEKCYFEGSEITKLNPDYEIMLDTVVLNTKTGKAKKVHENTEEPNIDLAYVLNNEISGHKVKIEKDKKNGETVINIIDEDKKIKELARTKNGSITSLHLYKTSEIGTGFLKFNKTLREFYAPKLRQMGKDCLQYNNTLTTLFIPELEEIGDNCFPVNEVLSEFIAPKLKKIGSDVFWTGYNIKKLYIPELEEMGRLCFTGMRQLTELNAPMLKKCGDGCFSYSVNLEKLFVPELEEMGDQAFHEITLLQEIVVPKLKKMGDACFMGTAKVLKILYAPELEMLPENSLLGVKKIKNLHVPKLKITEATPKCILRAIKLAALKDGIRKVLRVPQRNFNEKDAAKFQQVRESR